MARHADGGIHGAVTHIHAADIRAADDVGVHAPEPRSAGIAGLWIRYRSAVAALLRLINPRNGLAVAFRNLRALPVPLYSAEVISPSVLAPSRGDIDRDAIGAVCHGPLINRGINNGVDNGVGRRLGAGVLEIRDSNFAGTLGRGLFDGGIRRGGRRQPGIVGAGTHEDARKQQTVGSHNLEAYSALALFARGGR